MVTDVTVGVGVVSDADVSSEGGESDLGVSLVGVT
jgi:hypothetical protein